MKVVWIRWQTERWSLWHIQKRAKHGLIYIDCPYVRDPVADFLVEKRTVKPRSGVCTSCGRKK